jgi:hypothetical protein
MAAPAWAGGGGESLSTVQNVIGKADGSTGLCAFLSPLVGAFSCPQLPTLSQAILEVAGLEETAPEMVRALNNVAPGINIDAGNASSPPSAPSIGPQLPISPSVLSSLTPLAFASQNAGTAAPKLLNDPTADTFFYAVASGPQGQQPTSLFLFYEDLSRTNTNLLPGRTIAQFALPLTVLNTDNTERFVAATLKFSAPGSGKGTCSGAQIIGNFSGNGSETLNASDIGVDCAVVFGSSAVEKHPHAIFEIQVPLLVTLATDPEYFYSVIVSPTSGPINLAVPTAFLIDTGYQPAAGILGSNGKAVGIAPSATPLCPAGTACPANFPTVFPFCANLPTNGNGQAPVPAVAVFYVIATDGETLLSAPLSPTTPISCPF